MIRRALTVLVSALVLAGAALAYWAGTGAGSGNGASDTPAPLAIAPATATGSLLPTGLATGDVEVTVTNGNAYPVHLPRLELDATRGDAGFDDGGACALGYSAQDNGGAGWTIPASTSVTLTLTDSMTMGTSAANSCQGQAFTVYLRGA